MASGRGHERVNFTFLFVVLAGYGLAHHYNLTSEWGISQSVAASFTFAFLVGTLLLTPDLDLAESHVLAKKHWGVLSLLWIPYGYVFTHRGLSHSWILGPLTRLIYLSGLVGLIGVIIYMIIGYTTGRSSDITWDMSFDFESQPPLVWIGGIVGFYLSQWTHLLADGVLPWHGFKRIFCKR
ncbi:MAG: metal-binding protein [Myxococcales bacterium]|nr:metal-binding protein [Myxococcales bacterium]